MENDPKVLVSTDWLFSRLSDPEIRILDATWYLPNIDRDAKAEYDECSFDATHAHGRDNHPKRVPEGATWNRREEEVLHGWHL